MSGPFDFLHIKRRTEGSSNELSFDVLDAARSDVDAQKKHPSRNLAGPKPSQGSYHGVAGTSTLSAVPEVERRKKARRARTRRIWLIAALALVTLVGTGAFLGYRYHQDKMGFESRFNVLIDRLVEVDKTLVEVDDLMQDPFSMIDRAKLSKSESISGGDSSERTTSNLVTDEMRDLSNSFTGLKRDLNSISAEARSMKDQVKNEERKVVLTQVEYAASARARMIENAEETFEIALKAGKRILKTNEAWNKVMEADGMARAAAEKSNGASTEKATLEAKDQTESARVLFQSAKEDLQALEPEEPPIRFTDETNYINKRIDSLDYAIKTANALLANNKEGAVSANNAYNVADKEAAALATKLPSSEENKVMQVYQSSLDKKADEYGENRAAASTADSSIRAYLGSQ